jgi:cytochrome oxidase assembly protein ShyY1
VYGGYGELVTQQPAPDLDGGTMRLLPPPKPTEGPHLAYAFQWFLFALIALGGYVVLARREAQETPNAAAMHVPAARIPG